MTFSSLLPFLHTADSLLQMPALHSNPDYIDTHFQPLLSPSFPTITEDYINIQKKKMAFVYRSRVDPYPTKPTPGPAYYRPQSSLPQAHVVPFNQSSSRKIWQSSTTPGPGFYSQDEQENKQVILQSGSKMFTLTTTTETSTFKSGSQRFKKEKEEGPGPGDYILDKVRERKENSPICQQTNLQRYLRGIHQLAPKAEEDLLAMIGEEHSREGCNNLESSQNEGKSLDKKNVPFWSTVERERKERPKTSVGPGSYNLQQKTAEVQDLPQKEKGRRKSTQSLARIKRPFPEQLLEASKKQDDLALDVLFHSCKTEASKSIFLKRSYNQKAQDFFGSTVSRFMKTEMMSTPGPGDYDLHPANCSKVFKPKKNNLSFGRYAKSSNQQAEVVISPFVSKQPEDRTPPKQPDRTLHCNFGSNQPRFREVQQSNLQGSAALEMRIGTIGSKDSIAKRSFKKQAHLHLAVKQKDIEFDERPLSYAPMANTIECKVGYKQQSNAPFSCQAPRFHQQGLQTRIIDEYLAQAEKQSKKGRKGRPVAKNQPKGFMASNNPRFKKQEQKNVLGPWSYDPQGPPKKEFNKLFC